MLYWLYDIPHRGSCGHIRCRVRRCLLAGYDSSRVRLFSLWSTISQGSMRWWVTSQYFGVIYGLLLGLPAVATYQNLSDVEKTVGNEASSLAALYRDVSALSRTRPLGVRSDAP